MDVCENPHLNASPGVARNDSLVTISLNQASKQHWN